MKTEESNESFRPSATTGTENALRTNELIAHVRTPRSPNSKVWWVVAAKALHKLLLRMACDPWASSLPTSTWGASTRRRR